jgi:hypothetical protein
MCLFAAKALHVPCLICQSWKWYVRYLCLKNLVPCHKCVKFLILGAKPLHDVHQWEVSYLKVDTCLGGFDMTWDSCRCLWWPCDENSWPCMKFVSYMLYVLFLLMIRSHAHEREIFVKNASFSSWLCHLLICPFVSGWRFLCSNCGYHACLFLNFSML